jgi:hypothetical protein
MFLADFEFGLDVAAQSVFVRNPSKLTRAARLAEMQTRPTCYRAAKLRGAHAGSLMAIAEPACGVSSGQWAWPRGSEGFTERIRDAARRERARRDTSFRFLRVARRQAVEALDDFGSLQVGDVS